MKKWSSPEMLAGILLLFASAWSAASPAYCADWRPLQKPLAVPVFDPVVLLQAVCFSEPNASDNADILPVDHLNIQVYDYSSWNKTSNSYTSFNIPYNFKVVWSYFDLKLQQAVKREVPRSAFSPGEYFMGSRKNIGLQWSSGTFRAKMSAGIRAEVVYVATPGDPVLPPVTSEVAGKRVKVATECYQGR